MNTTAPVIALDHPAALDATRVGRKAADLAAARAAGLPAAAGVVLTTDWATSDVATATQVWRITSQDGARPLVVRPSTVAGERTGRADDAIRPSTVVGDLGSMLAAIGAVRAADASTPVLLQHRLVGAWQGVLYADDTATARRARPLVVARGAHAAAGGDWIGELDHTGRVRVEHSAGAAARPPVDLLARVVRLADKVAGTFAGPHDVEWIADGAGRTRLLRVRPGARVRNPSRPAAVAGPGDLVRAA